MSDSITIFDNASLQKHVDAVLADVPAGRTHAAVGYYLTNGRWRVSYAQRIGKVWVMGATFGKDSAAGKINGGVTITGSW
jgi:hypothetical protein